MSKIMALKDYMMKRPYFRDDEYMAKLGGGRAPYHSWIKSEIKLEDGVEVDDVGGEKRKSIIALIKEFGYDLDKIVESLGGLRNRRQVSKTIANVKAYMKRKPNARDEEFLAKLKGVEGRSSESHAPIKGSLCGDYKKLISLVKEHGKDYKRITEAFDGKKSTG